MTNLSEKMVIDPSPADYGASLSKLLEAYARLLVAAGASVEANTAAAQQRFATYPRELQAQIYDGLVKNVSAVIDIVEGGIPLEDTERSLWCIFKKHGLRPPSDLFASIEREDFITIYLPNHAQWYRSFNYHRVSSYSLGELICTPWHELYEFEGDQMAQFLAIATSIFENRTLESVFPKLSASISRERFSARRLTASLNPKIIAPLRGLNGTNEACIVSWKIEILGSAGPRTGHRAEAATPTSLHPMAQESP